MGTSEREKVSVILSCDIVISINFDQHAIQSEESETWSDRSDSKEQFTNALFHIFIIFQIQMKSHIAKCPILI
jgi:hypothetical protein